MSTKNTHFYNKDRYISYYIDSNWELDFMLKGATWQKVR